LVQELQPLVVEVTVSDRLSAGAVSTIKRSNRFPKPSKQARKPQNPDAAVEMRYRAILEQIPAVIYTDSINDNHTLYINPQIQYITGYTPEEWMEDDLLWYKIILKEDQEKIWSENLRTEKTGETYKTEYRLRTREGIIKWVHDEAWLIRDKRGKPLFWQGYIIDITERKQIELELEQRAAELTALQETVLYLTARHSLPDLLNLIVERATKLLCASNGLLYLVNEEAQKSPGSAIIHD
jgi:PAS domain S-box-containing protein